MPYMITSNIYHKRGPYTLDQPSCVALNALEGALPWVRGANLGHYYDYFLAKGFFYGARMRGMSRKFLAAASEFILDTGQWSIMEVRKCWHDELSTNANCMWMDLLMIAAAVDPSGSAKLPKPRNSKPKS